MRKAIAMKCTQEQWNSICCKLEHIENDDNFFDFSDYPYLTNNYGNAKSKKIGSHSFDMIRKGTEIHETWNEKVFLEACGIDTEEDYRITKLQLTQLLKNNIEGNDQLVSADLRAWFPEVFKKELEVSKWYKHKAGALVFKENKSIGYGFNYKSNFETNIKNWSFESHPDNWKEATTQEVEAALTAEAKKRGFKKGCSWRMSIDDAPRTAFSGEYYYFDGACLRLQCGIIFENGIWATIIPTITKEEAEKRLGVKIE